MNDTATLDRPANPLATLATLAAPDEATLNAGPAAMLRMAKTFTVNTDEDYSLAAEELRAVKAKSKALEEKRTGIVGPLNKAVKAINDLFRGPLEALTLAESTLKNGMLGYTAAQERIAAEAKRRAEALAQAERDRLAAEARAIERAAAEEASRVAAIESQRVAAAAAETARLAKIAAEAAAAGDAEATRLADEAAAKQRKAAAEAEEVAAAERASKAQAAALEIAAVQNVSAVIVAPTTTAAPVKVAGVSVAKSFDYEVEDMVRIIKHIAAHPEFASLLMLDSTKTRALVRSLGPNTKIDGLRVIEKKSVRSA